MTGVQTCALPIFEELRTIASSAITDGELRGFLGRFLFTGDDVFKPVSALSGGEKGRLALAKLIYSRINVLVLDEPTNHLDIASCEALEDALNEFDGTIITVSHDRYFLDRIATQILAFTDKGAEYFDGGYSEFYDAHHRTLAEQQAREAEAQKAERQARKVETPKQNKTNKSRQKAPNPAEIEAEIHTAEAELHALAALLSTEEVARDKDKLFELSEKYEELEAHIAGLYQKWEAALEV